MVSEAEEVIKIGVIGPMTGGLASIGEDIRDALLLFVKENPKWGGEQVEIIVEDDQCAPTPAVNAANKLISTDKVQILFVDSCSGPYLSVAPIANKNKVLQISSLSTSPEITTASGEYGFRNSPSDDLSSTVIVDYMAERYSRVAVVSENTDFAQAYRAKVKEKAAAKGMQIVFDDVFNPETTDFKTMLQNLQKENPDVIASLINSGSTAGIFSKQRVELGIDIPEVGTDVNTAQEYFDIAKNAAEGMVIAVTAVDPADAKVQEFIEKFTAEYGAAPTNPSYAALSWDKANIIKNAIEAVGYDADAIKDWLYEMPPYDGTAGVTEFDENGDGSILPRLMVVKNGGFEIWRDE